MCEKKRFIENKREKKKQKTLEKNKKKMREKKISEKKGKKTRKKKKKKKGTRKMRFSSSVKKKAKKDMLGKICEKEMRQFLKNGLREPHGQRLTMVNSVLSALPTTLKLPKKIIQYIDRARRHCLWRKSTDPSSSVQSMAACDLVCKPKNKGGLGIVNLEFQNIALLAKNLDKSFNRQNLQWVNLIWDKY